MKQKWRSLAAAGLICTVAAFGIQAGDEASADGAETTTIGNQMPDPAEYDGLTRQVLLYSDAFNAIVETAKERELAAEDWAPLEALVDVEDFERMGVFLGDEAEVIDWETYKHYITQYGAHTAWEGTLRRVTEVPGLVLLELEERNTVNGVTDVANTVTIYEFNEEGLLTHLDVYVMPLP